MTCINDIHKIFKGFEHSGNKGSDGWIAPYDQVNGEKIKSDLSEDVFILGCFYYYVLDSKHRHPFGNNVVINSREKEIKNKDHKVYRPDWNHGLSRDKKQPESQAIAIIKEMIQYDPKKRPKIKSILDRSYFLPEDYYKLYDVPHQIPGLCVIFNQEKFDNVAHNREGSEKDKESLRKIFEEFGFKVDHHDNLKANELNDQINKLATKKYTEYGCLVVCILSHGDEGTICTSDGSQVSIEETKKKFYLSKSLKDKPKIWIIQACQGGQLQEDFEIEKMIETSEENQSENTTLETGGDAGDPEITGSNSHNSDKNDDATDKSTSASTTLPDIPRPPVSDFLDIRATVPGCKSFRDPEKGSLLIQNLCEQMCHAFSDDEKSNRHLEDVLKKVQKEISRDIRWGCVNDENEKNYKNLLQHHNPNEIKWEPVTEKDIQIYHKSAIQPEFYKTCNNQTGKCIFIRPCQQTIEWRSTLMDFIRFEKKIKIDPSSNQEVPPPKRVKR